MWSTLNQIAGNALSVADNLVRGVQNCLIKPHGWSESYFNDHSGCRGNRFSIFNYPASTGGDLDIKNLPEGLAIMLGVYLFIHYNVPQKMGNLYHFLCPKPNETLMHTESTSRQDLTL